MKKDLAALFRSFIFSSREVGRALSLTDAAARVACHRYAKRGVFVRLQRNVYALSERWKRAALIEMYAAANRLQIPSYISLTSALSYYELTTQVQQNFFESIAVTRTKTVRVGGSEFRYVKIHKSRYFGFIKEKGIFIATPEKALLDALYLVSLHRYRLDTDALDISKFDRRKIDRLSRSFPEKTQRIVRALWMR